MLLAGGLRRLARQARRDPRSTTSAPASPRCAVPAPADPQPLPPIALAEIEAAARARGHAAALPPGLRRRQPAAALWPVALEPGAVAAAAPAPARRAGRAPHRARPGRERDPRAQRRQGARHAARVARGVQPLLRIAEPERGPGAPARDADPQQRGRRPRARAAELHGAAACAERRCARRREGAGSGERCRGGGTGAWVDQPR